MITKSILTECKNALKAVISQYPELEGYAMHMSLHLISLNKDKPHSHVEDVETKLDSQGFATTVIKEAGDSGNDFLSISTLLNEVK